MKIMPSPEKLGLKTTCKPSKTTWFIIAIWTSTIRRGRRTVTEILLQRYCQIQYISSRSGSLIDKKNSELLPYHQNHNRGGYSIIFDQHHKVGQTFIRNNPNKPYQKICGSDANPLYLYCIGKHMPTGPFVRRKLDNDVEPEKMDKNIIGWIISMLPKVSRSNINWIGNRKRK